MLRQCFSFLHEGSQKCFIPRGTPTYENENKTKRQFEVYGDYSGIANYRAEIPVICRGILENFRGISLVGKHCVKGWL